MTFTMNRRAFLRGAAYGTVATLALPPLEAMLNTHGDAYADCSALPTFAGLWSWANGIRPEYYNPIVGSDGQWTVGSNRDDLEDELSPLLAAGLGGDITVVKNLKGRNGHYGARATMLTGSYNESENVKRARSASITRLIADAWRGEDKLGQLGRSFDAGVSNCGWSGSPTVKSGALIDTNGQDINISRSPDALYANFVEPYLGETRDDPSAEFKKTLYRARLDALHEQAKKLKKKLGANDKSRVDSHIAGYDSLTRQLEAFNEKEIEFNLEHNPWTSRTGGALSLKNRDGYYREDDRGAKELLTEKHEIMTKILIFAMVSDLTRVFSMTFTHMQSNTIFWQVGADTGAHLLTHDDKAGDGGPMPRILHKTVLYSMENLAYFLNELKRTEFCGSNLLDHSLVLCCSDLDDATRHTATDLPVMLAGRAGGQIASAGKLVDTGGSKNSEVLLTMMHALGIEEDRVGDEKFGTTRTISEILA